MRQTVPCTYLKYNGSVCDKMCYGGLCGMHVDRKPHTPCLGCGHGTYSVTGYCAAPGPCLIAQRAETARTLQAAKRAAAKHAPASIANVELDKFVDELFAELVVT